MSSHLKNAGADDRVDLTGAKEREKQHGNLSVFLGYAAGVGKTYAMLDAARARHAAGADVVVACIETHGQAETDALLQALEIVPGSGGGSRATRLGDLDVDAVLRRRPQLAVVDELAHANDPGARHPKRFQDVQELLSAGIDVYATLNIQDLESLKDVVAQITGILVAETIPDRILDDANEINLVDLSPDELLQRREKGMVHLPEKATQEDQFFRRGSLTALREIALRRAAARVDDQMRAYMQARAIPGPWPAADRLLVCVSPGTLGERLIRTTKRLADDLKAEWFAIYVETPEHARLAASDRGRIAHMLQLAQELGAQVLTLSGPDVAKAILTYAHTHNVTKIIAGKHAQPRWAGLWRGSVVDQILRESGGIDVYVISGEAETALGIDLQAWQPHRPWRRYLLTLGLVALTTLLSAPLAQAIAPTNLVMFYLVAVVIAAVTWGRGPSVLAAVLGVLALDFFFVPPHYTFAVADTQYLLTFFGFLMVGLVISALTVRVREQADIAERRRVQTTELYELTRALAASAGLEEVLQAIITHVGQTFGRDAMVWLPEGDTLKPHTSRSSMKVTEDEFAAAKWAFEHGEPAGSNTTTLPHAGIRCIPLQTAHGVVGVLGSSPADPALLLPQEQWRLLESFASQSALAIERVQFAEQAKQTQVLQATEKLQTALLNSISHDLRTPLVSITGTLSTLLEDGMDPIRQGMIETAYAEARRLNHLVGNLLDMTRIEAGAMRVRQVPCDVQDVIGSALEQLSDRLKGRKITVELSSPLPLVPMDFVLIVEVLVNLLENACKYSPPNEPIEVQACVANAGLEIRVADRGIGIPAADLQKVFDKFFRVQRPDGVMGTGLGLAICKGIVEAHHGKIWAENRAGGGTVVTVLLPLPSEG